MNDLMDAVDAIHSHTAVFTCDHVIDRMLDEVGWPTTHGRLLDPGAGHADVILRAIARMDVVPDETDSVATRLEAWEFHPEAARVSRQRVALALEEKGWSPASARIEAGRIVVERDFLLEGPVLRRFEMIVGNPPYAARSRIPQEYRRLMDDVVPDYARQDMMHPYLESCSRHLAPGGRLALVTSDRWLMNANTARLREVLGERLTFDVVERIGTDSPFYVPKTRRRDAPPRVHPVLVVARNAGGMGVRMGKAPVVMSARDETDHGPTLGDRVRIMVAPWMGAKGIFVVKRGTTDLPDDVLIPCALTGDIHPHENRLLPLGHAVVRTGAERPCDRVMRHLDREMDRMAPKGRRSPRWLPPTAFAHKLPLSRPGLLIPRIATRLRAIPLPQGVMAVNSNLVVADCEDPEALASWLDEPEQQEWIARNAPPLENGYLSITTTLLRRLPAAGLPGRWRKAA